MPMIVKVQSSIATTASRPQVMVYDETRKYGFQGDLPEEMAALLNGRPKAYFEAEVIGTELEIGKEVEPQPW